MSCIVGRLKSSLDKVQIDAIKSAQQQMKAMRIQATKYWIAFPQNMPNTWKGAKRIAEKKENKNQPYKKTRNTGEHVSRMIT